MQQVAGHRPRPSESPAAPAAALYRAVHPPVPSGSPRAAKRASPLSFGGARELLLAHVMNKALFALLVVATPGAGLAQDGGASAEARALLRSALEEQAVLPARPASLPERAEGSQAPALAPGGRTAGPRLPSPADAASRAQAATERARAEATERVLGTEVGGEAEGEAASQAGAAQRRTTTTKKEAAARPRPPTPPRP